MIDPYIEQFESALVQGRQEALNKLLGSNATPLLSDSDINSFLVKNPTPLTQLGNELTTINGYNTALTTILADLGSLYSESANLWRIFNSIQNLAQHNITNLNLSIKDLQSKIAQAKDSVFNNNSTYTDNILGTFNSGTSIENDLSFYQAGTLARAFIDTEDDILKLPVDGEFINQLAKVDHIPSNVYLDRITGHPVAIENTANYSFDGSVLNFWNEVIHSNQPIYVSNNQYPWLPVFNNTNKGYKGGAACRIKIEFENITQISELFINPYGQNPSNFIALGWTNKSNNLLTDPDLNTGFNSYWSLDTNTINGSYSATGAIYQNAGPNNNVAVQLLTYNASANIYLKHTSFAIQSSQGIEISFVARTKTSTPIVIGVTFISSGGLSLDTREEIIEIGSNSWTQVVTSFDPVPGTTSCTLKIGIPQLYNKLSEVWVSNLFIENINEFVFYEQINNKSTIFLPYPINVLRAYLIFSQENYIFKHYTSEINIQWDRLSRITSDSILDWNLLINKSRIDNLKPSSYLDDTTKLLRGVSGTSWSLLQDLVRLTGEPEEYNVPTYEYEIGAFEIYLRHREYAPQGRFITLPIDINGEIREITLQSQDSIVDNITSAGSVNYTIIINENDSPENGLPILNSNSFISNLSSYPTPPATIPYLDYTTWSTPGPQFQAITWIPATESAQLSDILTIQITDAATPGMFIQKNLTTAIDLRGANTLTAQFHIFTPQLQRIPALYKFKFGISNDGVNWLEQTYPAGISGIDETIDQQLFTTIVFNLNAFTSTQKNNIKFIRLTIVSPSYYPLLYFYFRKLEVQASTGNRTIKIQPSDDLIDSDTNIIVPVKGTDEDINGTDRYNRVFLKYYPYINKRRIANVLNTVSANTGGRIVGYDPNAINPKYLDSSLNIKTTIGYRPIEVTLTFKDTGQVIYPDSLGKPQPGEVLFVSYETLQPINTTQTSQTVNQSTDLQKLADTISQISLFSDVADKIKTQLATSQSSTTQSTQTITPTWQTRFSPLATGRYGVNIVAWWSSGATSGDVLINPLKISVLDQNTGTIQINIKPPTNLHTQVKASYYYVVGENSPRENFYNINGNDLINNQSAPQNYPITRNVTDYLNGTTPILRSPVFDLLNPDYYPVYEYYLHKDGYIIFSQDFHPYADTPANINIKYDTLAIMPRLVIDLTRDGYTNQTPYVKNFNLLFNTRYN